jgi:hypothetical protein
MKKENQNTPNQNTTIKFYNSHEESEMDELMQVQKQSHYQRINDAVELILRVFNETEYSGVN